MIAGSGTTPYGDTPEPKVFGTVSPLDPRLFATAVEWARDVTADWPNAKYSPVDVAQWLEEMAAAAEQALSAARVQTNASEAAEFRRIEEDVLIQIGVGIFFAKKLRSAVLWEIAQKTGDANAASAALSHYREARTAWATMAKRAQAVYRADVGYGRVPMRRGHWMDRLTSMDEDISAMQAAMQAKGGAENSEPQPVPMTQKAVEAATVKPQRLSGLAATHTPADSFVPGQPLEAVVELGKGIAPEEVTVRMRYRHVDQAERWQWLEMERKERSYRGTIPADYTHSAFPLEYFFELKRGNEAWMMPGFNATLSNQPYYAVVQKK
jgi:hypothetical protein